MKHEFQPILNEKRYNSAVIYIAQQAGKLVNQVLGRTLPIDTLTVFSQSEDEYEFISQYLRSIGPESELSHGTTLYVNPTNRLEIDGHDIELLGTRKPDSTRPEVGYADFPVCDYQELKTKAAVAEITAGSGVKLLELKLPEFDVRGYIVQKESE